MKGWLTGHPITAFVLLSFGISWPLGALALHPASPLPEAWRGAFDYAAKFGPSLAGLLLAARPAAAWRSPCCWAGSRAGA